MKWGCGLGAVLVLGMASLANAGPQILTYQGSVSDSGGTPVADGAYDVRFSLYDDAVAGTQRWTETQSVEVQGGLYSAILGESTAFGNTFNWYYDLWLEVAIEAKLAAEWVVGRRRAGAEQTRRDTES